MTASSNLLPPEKDLWRQFLDGDSSAFEQLFLTYADPLFRYGQSLSQDGEIIQDSIQDVFSDFWERRNKLSVPAHPKAFVFSAFRYNLTQKAAKASRRSQLLSRMDKTESYPSAEAYWIAECESQQFEAALRQAVSSLPPRQQEVIHLRYFQELSYKEIAGIMEVKPGSVGRFLARAIESLQKRMLSSVECLPVAANVTYMEPIILIIAMFSLFV